LEEEDFEKVVHPANEDDDNTNTNDDEGMILMAFFFCARTTKRECLRTNGVKRRGKKRRTSFSLLDGGPFGGPPFENASFSHAMHVVKNSFASHEKTPIIIIIRGGYHHHREKKNEELS